MNRHQNNNRYCHNTDHNSGWSDHVYNKRRRMIEDRDETEEQVSLRKMIGMERDYEQDRYEQHNTPTIHNSNMPC